MGLHDEARQASGTNSSHLADAFEVKDAVRHIDIRGRRGMPATPDSLAAKLGLGASRAQKLIANMETAGLVQSIGPGIRLSNAGRQLARQLMRVDPAFLNLPFLKIIGASPAAVLKSGGCCSGLTRLAITALQTVGIRASQITLYNRDDCTHCLIEVVFEGTAIAADPSYGIYYVDRRGRFIGMEHLREGKKPTLRSLPGCKATGYPDNPYYLFSFHKTRTANWTGSTWRRVTYACLRRLLGSRIDNVKVHPWFEWPQIILATAIAFFAFAANGVWLLLS